VKTTDREGTYFRIADPGWDDPLDGSYSARYGGRWNSPGSFPVCYLNRDLPTARANARQLLGRRLEGLAITVDDLDPDELPVLIDTSIERDAFVDVVTDDGCVEAGLDKAYPLDRSGQPVPWEVCQSIGVQAWDRQQPGIACRSAADGAPADGEELAWFQRGTRLTVAAKRVFVDWFGPIDWP
jgi:hypothetical protein